MLLGASLLLSACAGEEDLTRHVDGHQNEPICFRTTLPTVSSRVGIVTTENIKYFHVTAFNTTDEKYAPGGSLTEYFNDQRVDIKEGDVWHTSDSCVWPLPGRESDALTFIAYSPAKNDGATLVNNSTISGGTPHFDYKLEGFQVAPDIAHQMDFVTANAAGSMADNLFSGITLNFRHQLARVEVKAWSAHKSCHIEIAGVRIGQVNMNGIFHFNTEETGGTWSDINGKGIVEYIYRDGDKIVRLNKGAQSTSTAGGAVSIMGSAYPDDNSAMLLPSDYSAWDFEKDPSNNSAGMYISVLLRIEDATPTAGIQPVERQRYPYRDLVQGVDALTEGISRVYFAVNKNDNTIACQLFKNNETDYDPNNKNYCTADGAPYAVPADQVVKEFGWASLPVSGNWAPGHIYTYTLDYSHGIGIHEPTVNTQHHHPGAGDPIISDLVGCNVTVAEWKIPTGSLDFEVTGH